MNAHVGLAHHFVSTHTDLQGKYDIALVADNMGSAALADIHLLPFVTTTGRTAAKSGRRRLQGSASSEDLTTAFVLEFIHDSIELLESESTSRELLPQSGSQLSQQSTLNQLFTSVASGANTYADLIDSAGVAIIVSVSYGDDNMVDGGAHCAAAGVQLCGKCGSLLRFFVPRVLPAHKGVALCFVLLLQPMIQAILRQSGVPSQMKWALLSSWCR